MSNLLKFLLTIALGMCFLFSVMLMFGCEGGGAEPNKIKKECGENYIYNEIMNNCVYEECSENIYFTNEQARLMGYQGCFQGCYIDLANFMECTYKLTSNDISEIRNLSN